MILRVETEVGEIRGSSPQRQVQPLCQGWREGECVGWVVPKINLQSRVG